MKYSGIECQFELDPGLLLQIRGQEQPIPGAFPLTAKQSQFTPWMPTGHKCHQSHSGGQMRRKKRHKLESTLVGHCSEHTPLNILLLYL